MSVDAVHTDAVVVVEGLRVVHHRAGVVRRRAGTVAVCDATLSLDEAEVVGVVGESGSGKSSMAHAICMLVRPVAGSVRLAGRELTTARGRRLRRLRADVQVIFQDPHGALDPRQTVGSGLAELRRLHGERTAWVDDAALLDLVGLGTDLLTRLPHELSGGQAQRVCIARALLLRPRLLIADEPTSALDVSVQAQILSLLGHLASEQRIAILLISHDLAVVRAVCSRVHVMRSGEIVEAGEIVDVFDHPQHPYTKALLAAVPTFGAPAPGH